MGKGTMHTGDIAKILEGRPVGAIGGRRFFSVMILLVERDGKMHLLFEQRAQKMKAQPGDVCFPGGRMEAGETPLACALRETYEEIGISPEKIRILGQFDTMYEIAGITLHTFVGAIDGDCLRHLTLSEGEVDHVFTVPYEFFAGQEPWVYESKVVQKVDDFPYEKAGIRRDYPWRTGANPIPIYQYGEGEERQVIWGLTGRIVRWFVQEMEAAQNLSSRPDFEG